MVFYWLGFASKNDFVRVVIPNDRIYGKMQKNRWAKFFSDMNAL